MKPGIFAKTFNRPTLAETLDAVSRSGLEYIQFNFFCVGLSGIPHEIESKVAFGIASALKQRSLVMAAVSGTCNLIHPDQRQRALDLERLRKMIFACRDLGTNCVTLCTGTRDPENMWKSHPDNNSASAWRELLTSLEQLLPEAEARGVNLGVEPEPANVINNALRARELLDQLGSPALKIVFDAANLVPPEDVDSQTEILSKAADLLQPEIVSAHAKDITRDPARPHVTAGKGLLNYSQYLSLLSKAGYEGPLLLHNLSEAEVPGAVAFLRKQLQELPENLR
jgi:sugar phosphate isomerase/epimerase